MFPNSRGAGPAGVPQMPPQMQNPVLAQSQTDQQARDKLTQYVYEYLAMSGASKTAESFKEEILTANPNMNIENFKLSNVTKQSFLSDWWSLFWDLYCAAPERRGEMDASIDAKHFHEHLVPPMQPPSMMNGQFVPPMGMEMMGHPGAFGNRFGPPGPMRPGGIPPQFGMFPDPRMRQMPANPMRMGPTPGFPVAGPHAGMRPGMPPGGVPPMGEFPGMRYGEFMPQPGFAGGMMPNGAMPMQLNSPGMGPPMTDPSMAPVGNPFMGVPPVNPVSSSAMFGMTDTPVPSGAPTTPLESSGPGSEPQTNATSVATPTSAPGMPTSVGQPTSLTNGEEIKTSPVTTPPDGNNGGASNEAPAPGSAQSGGANAPGTPSNGPLSQPLSASAAPADFKDDSAISKIKEGLLDGFKTEVSEPSFYAGIS